MNTVIPENKKNSAFINTSANILSAIFTPSTLTSTTFTFLAANSSRDDQPLHVVSDGAGGVYTVTFAAGEVVTLDASIMAALRGVVIVAGSTELGSDKTLELGFISR